VGVGVSEQIFEGHYPTLDFLAGRSLVQITKETVKRQSHFLTLGNGDHPLCNWTRHLSKVRAMKFATSIGTPLAIVTMIAFSGSTSSESKKFKKTRLNCKTLSISVKIGEVGQIRCLVVSGLDGQSH